MISGMRRDTPASAICCFSLVLTPLATLNPFISSDLYRQLGRVGVDGTVGPDQLTQVYLETVMVLHYCRWSDEIYSNGETNTQATTNSAT